MLGQRHPARKIGTGLPALWRRSLRNPLALARVSPHITKPLNLQDSFGSLLNIRQVSCVVLSSHFSPGAGLPAPGSSQLHSFLHPVPVFLLLWQIIAAIATHIQFLMSPFSSPSDFPASPSSCLLAERKSAPPHCTPPHKMPLFKLLSNASSPPHWELQAPGHFNRGKDRSLAEEDALPSSPSPARLLPCASEGTWAAAAGQIQDPVLPLYPAWWDHRAD